MSLGSWFPFAFPPIEKGWHAVREGETEIDAFRRIRDQIKLVFEACAAGYREAKA